MTQLQKRKSDRTDSAAESEAVVPAAGDSSDSAPSKEITEDLLDEIDRVLAENEIQVEEYIQGGGE